MRKFVVCLVMIIVCAVSCGKTEEVKAQEGFVTAQVAVYSLPGGQGVADRKWRATLNWGELVYVLPLTNTAPESVPEGYTRIMLSDMETTAWIEDKWLVAQERHPITIIEPTELYRRPDGPVAIKLETGRKALVERREHGEWHKIRIEPRRGENWVNEGWIRDGSFERGFVEIKEDQSERVFQVNTVLGKVSVRASSWLIGSTGHHYTPDFAFDGKLDTSWQEGKDGAGTGEWIEMTVQGYSGSIGVALVNGLVKEHETLGDVYMLNDRMRKLTVWYGANMSQSREVELLDEYRDYQQLGSFEGPVIRLVIKDVYPGEKWQDGSIAEIKLFQPVD